MAYDFVTRTSYPTYFSEYFYELFRSPLSSKYNQLYLKKWQNIFLKAEKETKNQIVRLEKNKEDLNDYGQIFQKNIHFPNFTMTLNFHITPLISIVKDSQIPIQHLNINHVKNKVLPIEWSPTFDWKEYTKDSTPIFMTIFAFDDDYLLLLDGNHRLTAATKS
ncbi:hypothetical protein HCA69_15650, partial [Listeria grandensis]|nr:hypothetical protein [Listeria grandensis]